MVRYHIHIWWKYLSFSSLHSIHKCWTIVNFNTVDVKQLQSFFHWWGCNAVIKSRYKLPFLIDLLYVINIFGAQKISLHLYPKWGPHNSWIAIWLTASMVTRLGTNSKTITIFNHGWSWVSEINFPTICNMQKMCVTSYVRTIFLQDNSEAVSSRDSHRWLPCEFPSVRGFVRLLYISVIGWSVNLIVTLLAVV